MTRLGGFGGQGSGGQSPSLWHQDTPLFVADTPPVVVQPIVITSGILAGGIRQDLGLTVAQAGVPGCPQRLLPGLLAQQGSQDKAAAIPRGWGRDKSGSGSPGTCLLLTPAPPTFMNAVVIPQKHLRTWEPLQSLLLSANIEGIIGYQPLGLGAQDRAWGLAVPPLYVPSCPPKPQPHVPSLYPFSIPKRILGLRRPPRQEGKARGDQGCGFQLGCETAWAQSHGQGVMCQAGGGNGIPQEDGAALLSLWNLFRGEEAPKKPNFHGLSAPCLGGFGDFRVWGVKNSGKAHSHGIRRPLFVADAHVSSPLLSLYGTS